jgi:hypothetical protein
MHRWAAHLMVLSVFLHMARVFYHGAYKPPREFNWVIGVILLTLTLLCTYLVLVFGGQQVLASFLGPNNAVVLVVSTLVVAALFQPLRQRVQQLVDRRFYRSKYDAAQVVAGFGARLLAGLGDMPAKEHSPLLAVDIRAMLFGGGLGKTPLRRLQNGSPLLLDTIGSIPLKT